MMEGLMKVLSIVGYINMRYREERRRGKKKTKKNIFVVNKVTEGPLNGT
jgi:hypothetical protein